ncbi:zinc-containing alcohol dehydrogenase [Sparganum proliferum]
MFAYTHGGRPSSLRAIHRTADISREMCYMRFEIGDCESFDERYGYDPLVRKCRPFLFSGCGGNANNFLTKEECKNASQICKLDDFDYEWPPWEVPDDSTNEILKWANLALPLRMKFWPLWTGPAILSMFGFL